MGTLGAAESPQDLSVLGGVGLCMLNPLCFQGSPRDPAARWDGDETQ